MTEIKKADWQVSEIVRNNYLYPFKYAGFRIVIPKNSKTNFLVGGPAGHLGIAPSLDSVLMGFSFNISETLDKNQKIKAATTPYYDCPEIHFHIENYNLFLYRTKKDFFSNRGFGTFNTQIYEITQDWVEKQGVLVKE